MAGIILNTGKRLIWILSVTKSTMTVWYLINGKWKSKKYKFNLGQCDSICNVSLWLSWPYCLQNVKGVPRVYIPTNRLSIWQPCSCFFGFDHHLFSSCWLHWLGDTCFLDFIVHIFCEKIFVTGKNFFTFSVLGK